MEIIITTGIRKSEATENSMVPGHLEQLAFPWEYIQPWLPLSVSTGIKVR